MSSTACSCADELAIIRVVTELATACDDFDFEAYRACYDDVLLITQPVVPGWETPREVSATEWVQAVAEAQNHYDFTHHRVFNHVVDVDADGDVASCRADVSGVMGLIEAGETSTQTLGGRYALRLRKRDDGWKISERTFHLRYTLGDLTLSERAAARHEHSASSH